MNRRELLAHSVLAAATLVGSRAFADPPAKGAPKPAEPSAKTEAARAVAAAAAECLVAGEACLSHCLERLARKDDSMAECARTVRDLLATCDATLSLASAESPHFAALAAVCGRVCRDCEAACKKHAEHHATCKRCMETCQRCAEACEQLAKG